MKFRISLLVLTLVLILTNVVLADPDISIESLYPTTDMNVTQNKFFNINLNVSCLNSDCGDVNVSLDPAGVEVENVSTIAGQSSSFSLNHTISTKDDRLLIIGVSLLDTGIDKEVSDVTFDGTSLTQIANVVDQDVGSPRIQMFKLKDPPKGTAEVNVTLEQGNKAGIGVIDFSGVDQSNPIGGNTNESLYKTLMFYTNTSDVLNGVYPNGEKIDLGVNASILGDAADLDSDGSWELPYIDLSGNLKIIDKNKEVQQLNSGMSTSKVVLGSGSWKENKSYVFYVDESDNNYIKKNRNSSSEITVGNGIQSNGVLGIGDFNGDGDKDLVFLGTSDTIKYRDDGTTYSTGTSNFGSNNNKGLGGVRDFDGDGQVRVPHVTGSNNLGLIDYQGNQRVFDSNYQSAVKTKVAGVDVSGDFRKEILHLNMNNNKLAYSFINGTTKMLKDYNGSTLQGQSSTGVSSLGFSWVDIGQGTSSSIEVSSESGDMVMDLIATDKAINVDSSQTERWIVPIESGKDTGASTKPGRDRTFMNWSLESGKFTHLAFNINHAKLSSKSSLVSTIPGDEPFYTNKTSNPSTLTDMSAGDSREVDFWVNATGDLDTTHEFFAYANMTSQMSISNETSHWNVTIVENKAPNQPILNYPPNNSTGVSPSPTLNVTVTDDDGDDMNVSFYDSVGNLIGEKFNLPSGSEATYEWTSLDYGKTYEWYVNITDGTDTTQSSTWNFTTTGIPPKIKIERLKPRLANDDYTSQKGEFFKTVFNVTCMDTDCGDVNVTLDPVLDYNKLKPLNVTSRSGSPTISKTIPLKITSGDDSTKGTGEIILNWTNIVDKSDIAVYDEKDNLLDYYIEELNSTKEEAVIWVYRDWIRDGSVQAKIAYGDGPSDQSTTKETVFDKENRLKSGYLLNEESGDALDVTSNNNDGTINGATQGVEGITDGAYNFNSGSVDVPNSSSFYLDENFTISFWLKTDAFNATHQTYILEKSDRSLKEGFSFLDNGGYTNDLLFRINSGLDNTDLSVTRSEVNDDSWHHIVGRKRGSDVSLYVDGSRSNAKSEVDFVNSEEEHLLIGFNDYDYDMDRVFVYERGLGIDELNSSYQAEKSSPEFFSQQKGKRIEKGIIPTTSGTPFYTNRTNNPATITLNTGDSEEITFLVNATGSIDSTYEFFAYANLTSDTNISDETTHWSTRISEDVRYSILNLTYPPNGSKTPRGKDQVREDTLGIVDNDIKIKANVYTNSTKEGIGDVDCNFYSDDVLIGTSKTNESGDCHISYDKTSETFGWHEIKVNHSNKDLPSDYSTITNHDINEIRIDNLSMEVKIENYRAGPKYYETDVAGINATIKRRGNFFNPQELTFVMQDQYDNNLETISEEISREGTGKYYAEALVPETDFIKWDVYAEHNFTGIGMLNATSSMHGDVTVEPANITINTTATKENDKIFENTEINIFKRGKTTKHKIFDDFFNTTSKWLSESLVKGEKYDVEFSMPDNNRLDLNGLKPATSKEQIKTHSSNNSGKIPSNHTKFSKVLASEAKEFDNATLYYSISYTPISICSCEGWNYTTNYCDTTWQCNSTEDYSHNSNTTHFWFNTTHFTGYAVGSKGETNLTIWDENASGTKEPVYGYGEKINFYANYTKGGSYIENSSCNITLWNGSTHSMNRSSPTSSVFNHTSVTPNIDDIYDWSVTCINENGYDNLTATDSFQVSFNLASEEIPEFGFFGMIMIIVFVISAYYFIRSHKET